ncbi:MAG: hypothetical protein GY725_13165 [bacterium]|nr:hypothetical protein [bacterium]
MAERILNASTYGKEPTRILLRVIEYERGERIGRAARIGLPLLGGAFISLFIPAIGHVLGIPGFLAASVFFSIRRLRQHESVDSLTGECPACQKEQSFPADAELSLPVTLRCPACAEFLKIEATGG